MQDKNLDLGANLASESSLNSVLKGAMVKMIRPFISALVAIALLATTSFASADTPDLLQQGQGDPKFSYYREMPATWPGFLTNEPFKPNSQCWRLGSASQCEFDSSTGGHGFIIAPLCEDVNQMFCIESIYAVSDSGVRVEARPLGQVKSDLFRPFGVETALGRLESRGPSYWSFDGKEGLDQTYLANLFTMVTWEKGAQFVDLVGVEIALTPVRIAPGGHVEKSLPTGFRFGMTMKLQETTGGFLMGRLKDLEINQVPEGSGSGRRVSIEAAPERVPKVGGSGPGRMAYSMQDANFLAEELSKNGDYARATEYLWRGYSRRSGTFGCAQASSGFYGSGSTNALLYAVDPPVLKDNSLTYSVAGVHFLEDGRSTNQGSYTMRLRSDVARCIYGFTNAPVAATVQVIGEDGSQGIAVTTVGEKNGWLTLTASGFSFSGKEIRVRVTQPFTKTLSKFIGSTRKLTPGQRLEIRSLISRAEHNEIIICTGTYVSKESKLLALARAQAVCNYAKSLDVKHIFKSEAKQTQVKGFDARVTVRSS